MNLRAPHCWLLLLLLLLLCRLMGRLPIGCMGRLTTVSACTCASLNQRSNPLAIFTNSVWMPQRKGLKRACERRRFVLGAACMDAQRASSQPRPLPLPMPLPLQLLLVPLLSGQPLTGDRAPRTGQGSQPGHAGSSISKAPSKPLKIINLSL